MAYNEASAHSEEAVIHASECDARRIHNRALLSEFFTALYCSSGRLSSSRVLKAC